MSKHIPLVSIVVPAYNAERYISATIGSVQAQTFTDWEMIIINDGSNDQTEEVIFAFLFDNRIKYFAQQNTGVSIARNNGIKKASGKYIAFLDADDAWEPGNLEQKVNLLESDPAIDWVFSDMYYADEHLNRTGPAPEGRDDNMLENILLWEGEVIPGPCSNIVIKKEILDKDISFDPHLSTAADQDLSLSLAHRYKGKRIPLPLWTYRVISSSMSRNIKVMEHDHLYVYRKAEKSGYFHSAPFRRKCFGNLYMILAGSWWVNGRNKKRALYFMAKAILVQPSNSFKLLKKLVS